MFRKSTYKERVYLQFSFICELLFVRCDKILVLPALRCKSSGGDALLISLRFSGRQKNLCFDFSICRFEMSRLSAVPQRKAKAGSLRSQITRFLKLQACLRSMWRSGLTSRIWFFWGSLTLPARQQWEMALWMMGLLDLALGSLKSLGPKEKEIKPKIHHNHFYNNTTHFLVITGLFFLLFCAFHRWALQ